MDLAVFSGLFIPGDTGKVSGGAMLKNEYPVFGEYTGIFNKEWYCIKSGVVKWRVCKDDIEG